MKDESLDRLMHDAKDTYRVPPTADFDAMWTAIEREHFDAPVQPVLAPRRNAWLPAIGIAATLLIGVGLGRFTAPVTTDIPIVTDAAAGTAAPTVTVVGDPLTRTTYEYIARTVALLDSLPNSGGAGRLKRDQRFAAQATQLLGTTRLLLDSPAATDPRLRDLLEDLELVLAQVASLRTAPRAEDLTFIAEAVNERDVVPRLRAVSASITASGY